jgi:DNA-binding GntR family transcriptional regulator
VTRQTLTESVYAQLRNAIITGRLRDGTQLKQVELARQLGVSRVPVREALRRLQAEHLVMAEPFQVYVVTSLNPGQVMELLDLREELEVFALRKTLSSDAREQRLRDARLATKALDLEQDGEAWLEADREFHRALNGRTTAVAAIIEEVRERIHRYLYSSVAVVGRRRQVLKEHAVLITALESGDEAALEDAIRHHLRGTRELLEQSLADVGQDEIDDEGIAGLGVGGG